MSSWRLIVDGRCPGATNMAVDRAIQITRDRALVPATLRLYGWRRPTVTLGRFQDAAKLDSGLCASLGVDVVRRFTGGRGVLHDDEVTYSVVAGVDDGVPRGVVASYRFLSEALAAAYRGLGLEADVVPRHGGVKGSAACYLHSTAADLSLDGKKLSGSAQVWLHDTVLQHGSLVITRDVSREAAVFGLERLEAERLAESTVTLSDELAEPPSVEALVEAVVDGFARTLGVTLEPAGLTDAEREFAETLHDEVHAPFG